jgi:hypothetical protein
VRTQSQVEGYKSFANSKGENAKAGVLLYAIAIAYPTGQPPLAVPYAGVAPGGRGSECN